MQPKRGEKETNILIEKIRQILNQMLYKKGHQGGPKTHENVYIISYHITQ